jgi:hypothetical protein
LMWMFLMVKAGRLMIEVRLLLQSQTNWRYYGDNIFKKR